MAITLLLLVHVPGALIEVELRIFGVAPVDKLVHLALFALFVWLWRRWSEAAAEPRVSVVWIVVLATLYGGALELLQPFVGRDAEWGDLAADAAGAVIAAFLPLLLVRRRR